MNSKSLNLLEEFSSYWQQYGELDDVAIVRDASGKSRGFGFVTFKELLSNGA